jgi:hypothetical protein
MTPYGLLQEGLVALQVELVEMILLSSLVLGSLELAWKLEG